LEGLRRVCGGLVEVTPHDALLARRHLAQPDFHLLGAECILAPREVFPHSIASVLRIVRLHRKGMVFTPQPSASAFAALPSPSHAEPHAC
jgi:hypothetical protein